MRTPSKHLVTILDMTPVNTAMTAFYREKHPDSAEDMRVEVSFAPYGIVDTPQGLFVICNEGVGNLTPLTGDATYTFEGYVHHTHSFAIMPEVGERLTADEIRALATDVQVPLHEHIRVFGGRLEDNYRMWARTLTSACESVTA